MTDACMRTPEVSRYVALAESTLTKMRLTGDGPQFVKVGARAVAYRKADLDAWPQATDLQGEISRRILTPIPLSVRRFQWEADQRGDVGSWPTLPDFPTRPCRMDSGKATGRGRRSRGSLGWAAVNGSLVAATDQPDR